LSQLPSANYVWCWNWILFSPVNEDKHAELWIGCFFAFSPNGASLSTVFPPSPTHGHVPLPGKAAALPFSVGELPRVLHHKRQAPVYLCFGLRSHTVCFGQNHLPAGRLYCVLPVRCRHRSCCYIQRVRPALVLCGDWHDPCVCPLRRDLFLLSSRNHVWEGSWNLRSKEYAYETGIAEGQGSGSCVGLVGLSLVPISSGETT